MRDFCSGRDAGEDRRLAAAPRRSASSSIAASSAPVTTPAGLSPSSAQTVRGHLAVVAGHDLHRDAEAGEARERLACVGFRRVGEAEEAREARARCSSAVSERRSSVTGAAGDGDDAVPARRTGRRARPAPPAGTAVQRASTVSGAPLAISLPSGWRLGEDRGELALVVERAGGEDRPRASVALRRCPVLAQSAWSSALPPTRLVSHASLQTEPEQTALVGLALPRRAARETRSRPSVSVPGLVGEEHVDVAEVLDADEPLDDHLALREPARAGREADRDDRRQQLRRQADGDREREQQRVEDRASEARVDREDRAGEDRRDRRRAGARSPGAPAGTAVCAWRSPRRSAIPPKAVRGPVRTTSPRPSPPRTIVPMNAQEGRSSGESPGACAALRLRRRLRLARSAPTRRTRARAPRAAAGRPGRRRRPAGGRRRRGRAR